jgi:hypothetical protein
MRLLGLARPLMRLLVERLAGGPNHHPAVITVLVMRATVIPDIRPFDPAGLTADRRGRDALHNYRPGRASWPPSPSSERSVARYLVIIGFVAGGAACAGEIANVTHAFQPEARSTASNSLYPLKLR